MVAAVDPGRPRARRRLHDHRRRRDRDPRPGRARARRPGRRPATWILVFVTVRSAFAAWAVAIRGAFRTRRISELGGWAIRAPLLAIALVADRGGRGRLARARRVGGAGEPRRPDDRRADRDHRRRLVGRPARDLRPAAGRRVVEAVRGGRRGPQRAAHLAGHRGGTPCRRAEPRRAGVRAGRARDRRRRSTCCGASRRRSGRTGRCLAGGDRGPRRGARAVAVGRRVRGRRGVPGRAGAGRPGAGRGSRGAVVGGARVVVAGRIAGARSRRRRAPPQPTASPVSVEPPPPSVGPSAQPSASPS